MNSEPEEEGRPARAPYQPTVYNQAYAYYYWLTFAALFTGKSVGIVVEES